MEQTLITQDESVNYEEPNSQGSGSTTFRECVKASDGNGLYHRKLFFLMAAYWIFASFFIALPFFLFKKPKYCEAISQGLVKCCDEGDEDCINEICRKYADNIIDHIKPEKSLTYIFRLFCGSNWARVIFKIVPETTSLVGFLIYGKLADIKGRQVAAKIAWRLFTLGIILFSFAQDRLLKSFGYILAGIHCLPCLLIQFVLFFEVNVRKEQNRESMLLLACLFVGPFMLSFFSNHIVEVDNRILLGCLCGIPSSILALMFNKIYESAICIYPYDKARAFGLINILAKENKKLPIIIDLSRSRWVKTLVPSTSLFSLLKHNPINQKLVVGLFFMFVATYNVKLAQVSLDQFTQTNYRSLLVNVPTTLADLTLCLLLVRLRTRTCRGMNILIIVLIISYLALREMDLDFNTMRVIAIIHAVLIRYLSELCYGLLLIWSIETFPTICRGYCVGLMLCGWPLGCLLVYLLSEYIEAAYIVGLVISTLAFVLEGYLCMDRFGIMKDTLEDDYYDEKDIYYRK